MAKKPAFLFYSNDYFEGTRTMLPEERACYVDLMVYQHQHDYIPNDIRRIAMYCVGVSEATLEATLEAKFKLCEKGWYNERLQEVMNDYQEYSKDQSDNGTYGQFIKKLNQDKSIKNITELKEFIKSVYTKERLIEDLKSNNDYKATLEALLKHRLNTRVESESKDEIEIKNKPIINNPINNNIDADSQRRIDQFEKICQKFLSDDIQNFVAHFKTLDIREQNIKEALQDYKDDKLIGEIKNIPYTYSAFKDWFKKYITDNREKYVHIPKSKVTYIDESVPRLELHAAFKFYWQEEYTIEYIREKIFSGEFQPQYNLNFDKLVNNKLIVVEND